MRLHYFNRDGVTCGHCKNVPRGDITHWSDKTGRPCGRCDHFEALHFLSGLCRLVGCGCKEFVK